MYQPPQALGAAASIFLLTQMPPSRANTLQAHIWISREGLGFGKCVWKQDFPACRYLCNMLGHPSAGYFLLWVCKHGGGMCVPCRGISLSASESTEEGNQTGVPHSAFADACREIPLHVSASRRGENQFAVRSLGNSPAGDFSHLPTQGMCLQVQDFPCLQTCPKSRCSNQRLL